MAIYYITKQLESKVDHVIELSYKYSTVEQMIEYFADKDEVQVDTETQGEFNFVNQILLIQFGDFDNQFVANFQELTLAEKNLINDKILNNLSICKLFHNSKFDIKFFWHHGMDIQNIYDTMLAEIILNAGKSTEKGFYSLYGVAKRYCNVELDKETRGVINRIGFTTRVIQYAADDVKYLSKIKEQQVLQLRKYGLAREDIQDIYTVCGLEMNGILALTEIEYNGIYLDTSKWADIKREVHTKVQEIEGAIDRIVNKDPRLSRYTKIYQDLFTPAYETTSVNWSSHSQKLKVLKEIFPDIESTAERELSRYKNKHPIVKALLEYSKAKKLATSFADTLESHINPVTKRIHTDIWPILDTGRISTSKPNLQQIPSRTELGGKMRACFTAQPGNKMVGGDYAQCELRIIAEASNDPVWVEAFKSGKDLHSVLCAMTFDIPIEDVEKPSHFKPDIKYRSIQKTVSFGLSYGMSEYKLADTIEVSEDVARGIIDKFFSKVPKVKEFLDMLGYLGKSRGFIRTPKPYQRIRWFDGYQNKDDFKRQGEIERASKNHPIQGGNADMTKLALVLIYREIRANNYPVKIIHAVHDEIQCECPEEFAETWKPIMARLMLEAAGVILKTIPMEVDCKISGHWSK